MKLVNKISRRSFLKALGGLGITGTTAGVLLNQYESVHTKELWITAQGREREQYSLSSINPNQKIALDSLAGFRGHGMCQNPIKPEQVIMFSRRPGTMGLVVDVATSGVKQIFNSETNHHMHGHGCFSTDGKILFYTESDYVTGKGKIILRETVNFEKIGEYSSYGIGPHEIRLMPDNKTLVVANGGLRTHPDSGRAVLNYETMRSTLTYIDSKTGQLISEHELDEPKASIRHLDVAQDGTVAMAIQVQRQAMSDEHLVSLAATHKLGGELQSLWAPHGLMTKLNDYMGSVRVHSKQRIAAFTSPRGDLAMFWNMDNLELEGFHVFHDVCGLTLSADENYFVLSNSAGKIRRLEVSTLTEDTSKRLEYPAKSWDNHMMTVVLPS